MHIFSYLVSGSKRQNQAWASTLNGRCLGGCCEYDAVHVWHSEPYSYSMMKPGVGTSKARRDETPVRVFAWGKERCAENCIQQLQQLHWGSKAFRCTCSPRRCWRVDWTCESFQNLSTWMCAKEVIAEHAAFVRQARNKLLDWNNVCVNFSHGSRMTWQKRSCLHLDSAGPARHKSRSLKCHCRASNLVFFVAQYNVWRYVHVYNTYVLHQLRRHVHFRYLQAQDSIIPLWRL